MWVCDTRKNRREKKERKMGQEIREEESLTERVILSQNVSDMTHEDKRTGRERERWSRGSFCVKSRGWMEHDWRVNGRLRSR